MSMSTFNFTTAAKPFVGKLGFFTLYWDERGKYYAVTHPSIVGIVCKVFPYKGETGTLEDPKKMFTVKADNYPGVGDLEQMVKGSDLPDYLDSLFRGRAGA